MHRIEQEKKSLLNSNQQKNESNFDLIFRFRAVDFIGEWFFYRINTWLLGWFFFRTKRIGLIKLHVWGVEPDWVCYNPLVESCVCSLNHRCAESEETNWYFS